MIEVDYLDKLTEKEKDWLNRFNEEYVNTNFKHDGDRIHPKIITKKKMVKNPKKEKKIDVYKNEAEQRNNARNRCILTRSKAAGDDLIYLEELSEKAIGGRVLPKKQSD